ncbi:hypothetical protein PG997_006002 [Apiospora hydei]|uniref:Uncharacterized protein n=1 Tax=Apiospora hydei TaxID=1337664 RepID=A0ABR1WMG6_9PEZI
MWSTASGTDQMMAVATASALDIAPTTALVIVTMVRFSVTNFIRKFINYASTTIKSDHFDVEAMLRIEQHYLVSKQEKETFALAEDRGVFIINFALNKTGFDMERLLKSCVASPPAASTGPRRSSC